MKAYHTRENKDPGTSPPRLARNTRGEAIYSYDSNNVPRYMYDDGTLDLGSTVNMDVRVQDLVDHAAECALASVQRSSVHSVQEKWEGMVKDTAEAEIPRNDKIGYLGHLGVYVRLAEAA